MYSLGEAIKMARYKAGLSGAELGEAVGLTKSTISKIENDEHKGGVAHDILIRIAEVLNAPDLCVDHCKTCELRKYNFEKYFPVLNREKKMPAALVSRLRKEMMEATSALAILEANYHIAEKSGAPVDAEAFNRELEKVIHLKYGIAVLEYELLLSG